jgi:glycosidase
MLFLILSTPQIAFCAIQAAGNSSSSAPQIEKLDPPNWWTGFTPEVMVLASGANLDGATLTCSRPGVKIERSKATAAGKYLFFWLEISPAAEAGDALIQVKTTSGATTMTFPILARESTTGKFQGFSSDDTLYLIMPDRFADGDASNDAMAASPGTFDRAKPRAYHGGDFRGIQQHLDYLQDLGVTAIWMTPIVDNDNSTGQDYHGYGAVDEYATEEHLGSLEDLKSLVSAAHAHGLKMIFDFVPNHVGPNHPWASAPPEPDWFHGTKEHHSAFSAEFQYLVDPHAPQKYWHDVVDGWFADVLPDVNQENADVAQYFIENALWWAETTGIDGYRLDTFPYVGRKFWSEWHAALRRAYPQMTTVGEVFNPDATITSFFAGGRAQNDGIDSGVTSVFDYPMYFAFRDGIVAGGSPAKLIGVLSKDHLYPHADALVTFVGNHDVPRLASATGATPSKDMLAYSILLTMRGTPQLYYGDEIGMAGGDDPENRHDFPGGFPGDPRNAFVESGRTPAEQQMFAHLQALLRLRKEHLALRDGALWHIQMKDSLYAYARISKQEQILVVFNAGKTAQDWKIDLAGTPLAGATQFRSLMGAETLKVIGNSAALTLAADECEIFIAQ